MCFLVASNVERVVSLWVSQLRERVTQVGARFPSCIPTSSVLTLHNQLGYERAMQELAERVIMTRQVIYTATNIPPGQQGMRRFPSSRKALTP